MAKSAQSGAPTAPNTVGGTWIMASPRMGARYDKLMDSTPNIPAEICAFDLFISEGI